MSIVCLGEFFGFISCIKVFNLINYGVKCFLFWNIFFSNLGLDEEWKEVNDIFGKMRNIVFLIIFMLGWLLEFFIFISFFYLYYMFLVFCW